MAGENPILAFAGGAVVGSLVTYVAVTTAQTTTPAKKKVTTKTTDPRDTGDAGSLDGNGRGGATFVPHRSSVQEEVPLPETPDDLVLLDDVICEVFHEDRDLADQPFVLSAMVFERLLGVEAPTVLGDHPSVVKLEGIVDFRILQMMYQNPDSTPRQNLMKQCTLKATLAT